MELKKLVIEVRNRLSKEIVKDPTLEKIIHVESRTELISVLRDRVFHNDKKVDDFLFSIEESEPEIKPLKKSELTETEFSVVLQKSLEKTFKEKSSKFKYVSHYFSTEKDLVLKIADGNGFESVYRIITIKTT